MNRTRITTITLLGLAILGLAIILANLPVGQKQERMELAGIHPLFAFDPELFYKGVTMAKTMPSQNYQHISGAVIPHHILVSYIIADFFKQIQSQKPKTIIILSPNHSETGQAIVQTSLYGWDTPSGIVEPDSGLIQRLIDAKLAAVDAQTLSKEHGIGAITPFMKHYLPDAKIVPLVFSKRMNLAQIKSVSDKLSAPEFRKDVVVVASVDFSHYLKPEIAEKNDTITLEAMRQFNYAKILSFNSDHTDSPPAIITLFQTMENSGLRDFKVLHNTNSARVLDDFTVQTTSYFSIIFGDM